jgi:hypothetical protein
MAMRAVDDLVVVVRFGLYAYIHVCVFVSLQMVSRFTPPSSYPQSRTHTHLHVLTE